MKVCFSPRSSGAVALCALISLMATSCAKNPRFAPAIEIVAEDRSGSTANQRADQKGFLGEAFLNAQNTGGKVGVWAVDRTAVSVLDVQKITNGAVVTEKLLKELETSIGKDASRTRPALFWEAMATQYGGASPKSNTQPIVIVYLTDGDNDWAADAPRIDKAVRTLAQNPQVKVALVGISNDLKPSLEKQMSPFGNRALVRGTDATPDAIAHWRNGEN